MWAVPSFLDGTSCSTVVLIESAIARPVEKRLQALFVVSTELNQIESTQRNITNRYCIAKLHCSQILNCALPKLQQLVAQWVYPQFATGDPL